MSSRRKRQWQNDATAHSRRSAKAFGRTYFLERKRNSGTLTRTERGFSGLSPVSLAHFAGQCFPCRAQSANALAEEYLNLVGLSDCFEKYPFELSGGMRQRGAIARALSVGAECLLLDEPFGALDPLNRALLQDLLLEICRGTQQKPMTTIFVTHDIKEAVYLGSRVIVLGASPGRIIAEFPLFFPVNKDREKWFYDTKIQGMVRSIEEAYQQDILAKIGVISQGGSNI